ncbi:MAG: DUF3108 domain-containing protein [Alphaproteobacteria bacterium]|nr:DUF3108 domain-containing protein [Alphaproteobacteria bacterium]
MRIHHLLTALFFICTSSTAFAAPPLAPFPKEMRYRIAWNNIKIGRVIIETNQSNYSYRMVLDTKTTGLAKMFSPLKSVTWAEGRFYNEQIIPQQYLAKSESDEGKNRTSHLTFDEEGLLSTRETNPVDDPNWRPEVPLEEARQAYDPVTAFFVLRKTLYENVNRRIKDSYVRTYDGRRLAEFNFRAINNGTKMRDDKIVPVVNTIAFRKPIHGYTPKELKKFDEGDPKVHIYFSADKRFLPLEFEIYHWSGKISASLEE